MTSNTQLQLLFLIVYLLYSAMDLGAYLKNHRVHFAANLEENTRLQPVALYLQMHLILVSPGTNFLKSSSLTV